MRYHLYQDSLLSDAQDPADAGMDNLPPPPEPVDPETLQIWANMRADDAGRLARELVAARGMEQQYRKHASMLQKRIEQLEYELQRFHEAENEEGQCAEWPRCACGRGGPDLCHE